ncbi:MAG TPA: acid phosphatase [Steroidobacteraceae bacterium]|jgi:acid phosphatase
MKHPTSVFIAALTGVALAVCACTTAPFQNSDEARTSAALRADIDTIVVIYAENRAFDNLYGNFPGAHNLSEVLSPDGTPNQNYHPQLDRDGKPLAALPPAWGGVTQSGYAPVVTQQQSVGLANAPFSIEHAYTPQSGVTLSTSSVTRDLWHRFYEHQMQIDGGKNDGYAAWSDAGGLALGHYDYSGSALFALAREFVLADNFFQGAFGGSFLNHQYLICACAPEYPDADRAAAKPSISLLEQDAQGHYLPRLKTAQNPPASALDEPPRFAKSGNLTPKDYFGDGKFHAINTMQPPFQPSGVEPAAHDASFAYADPDNAGTLPVQTSTTIGDTLDDKGVSWRWYAGSWNAALRDGRRAASLPREVIYAPDGPGASPDFQAHHQPFNYYQRFDPATHADARAAHLKDLSDLLGDIARGTLPHVVFYKPQGNVNQHAGYASVAEGDAHIADLVERLRKSAQWPHMLIVITYDEFGGAWDHVAPPSGDLLGPGARIPAIIVSPFAKKGSVDHTQYDTESILKLISRRFGLAQLAGMKMRDDGLKAHGAKPMGDLTNALDLR